MNGLQVRNRNDSGFGQLPPILLGPTVSFPPFCWALLSASPHSAGPYCQLPPILLGPTVSFPPFVMSPSQYADPAGTVSSMSGWPETIEFSGDAIAHGQHQVGKLKRGVRKLGTPPPNP